MRLCTRALSEAVQSQFPNHSFSCISSGEHTRVRYTEVDASWTSLISTLQFGSGWVCGGEGGK